MIDKDTAYRTCLYSLKEYHYIYEDLENDLHKALNSPKVNPEYFLISVERFLYTLEEYQRENRKITDKQKFLQTCLKKNYKGVCKEFKESSQVKELILGDDMAIWKEKLWR